MIKELLSLIFRSSKYFSKGMTSLSKSTMRSVWHWFRAQFATDLMSCQIFYYFLCLRTVWVVMAMSRMENFFLNVIKVHIYAYAHINIKYFDFLNDFWPLETGKSHENSRKLEDFEYNRVHLLKILPNNLIFFLFPKFLELFFTPVNTPPKLDKRSILMGTPCSW